MRIDAHHLAPTAGIDARHGLVVTVATDDQIILWDGNSGRPLARTHHERLAGACDISRTGRYVATSGGDGCARIWNTPGLEPQVVLPDHPQKVESTIISPDETRAVTVSKDRYARIFHIDGELLRTVSGQGSGILSAAWTDDGGQLVTSTTDATVRVWDSGTGLLISAIELNDEDPATVAVAGRNAFYVGGSDGRITFVADGDRYVRQAHDAAVSRIRYYAAFRSVVSSGGDHSIRFWKCRKDGILISAGEVMAPPQVLSPCFACPDRDISVFGTVDGGFAAVEHVTGNWRFIEKG